MIKFCKLFLCFTLFMAPSILSQKVDVRNKVDKIIADSINAKLDKAFAMTFNFKYKEALELVSESLKRADSIQNDSLIGRSYLVYGVINSNLGKYKEAMQYNRKAETFFSETKNYKYLGVTYNNIGWMYSIKKKKEYDSVVKYFNKALKAFIKTKNINRMAATVLNNLGFEYIEFNKLEKAELMLNRALKLIKKRPDSKKKDYSLSYLYISYGMLYLKQKKFNEALRWMNLVERIALEHKFENHLRDVYRQKSKIYDEQGRYEKSHIYLKKYLDKLKVAHEKENSKIIQEMSAKFELKDNERHLEKIALEKSIKENKLEKSNQIIVIITFLFIAILFVFFLLSRNNNLKKENNSLLITKNKELKMLQLKTEMLFLKTQIQPHFFFNTLNNLYALIMENSNKAENVVLKLSELMKYAMSDMKGEMVFVNEEIKNIKNYLQLESLRHQEAVSFKVDVIGDMKIIRVLPLLYITFIENCFKHNVVSEESFKLFISFKNIDNKYLSFRVSNTLVTKKEIGKKKVGGIGLENIERRLKLTYKDEYDLKILEEEESFSVNLLVPCNYEYDVL